LSVSRRRFLGGVTGAWLVAAPGGLAAQEGVFMRPEDAPRQLFPGVSDVTEQTIASSPPLQRKIRELLGQAPTLWEPAYRIFTLSRAGATLGFVVVVEEIGKHRPITYAVAIEPGGSVHDLAVLAYREAYGGEIRERRFLKQYARKTLTDRMQPYGDIRNISGATLSVEATGRAARKAIAVLKATGVLA
jgi:hypothetical protein